MMKFGDISRSGETTQLRKTYLDVGGQTQDEAGIEGDAISRYFRA
jgi:hypothetical protein